MLSIKRKPTRPKVRWEGATKIVEAAPTNRRSTLRPFTPKRQETNLEYERVVRAWQKIRKAIDGFQCQFIYASGRRCQKKAHPRPHHVKFRGKNLCDMKFFKALCLPGHHEWPHRHPKEAVERGLLIREYDKH